MAVDDEELSLECLLEGIDRAAPGAESRGFRRPSAAMVAAEGWRPDVALLDVEMRGMSGVELARRLQRNYPRVNIIFTTGYDSYTKEAMEMHASGYLLKPITEEKLRRELTMLRFPVDDGVTTGTAQTAEKRSGRLCVRTFGDFEVFSQGKPLRFGYRKTKELLAYLIDRKGSLCGNQEIIAVLWENCSAEQKVSYLQRLRLDLIAVLHSCGAEDVLVRKRGELAILPEQIDCDYYSWLRGEPLPDIPGGSQYCGEYMTQYSWAEDTNAWIAGKQMDQS